MGYMPTTLVVTTYNRPNALRCVLETVKHQSRLPDKVVVVDDGSLLGVREIIHDFERWFSIIHVWLPDKGFRAARARNLGMLRSADPGWIIFVDGDCLLPVDFIYAYTKLLDKNRIVSGSRILLGQELSGNIESGRCSLVDRSIFKGVKALSLPVGQRVRDFCRQRWQSIRTCNMGTERSMVFEVGGFDETYRGWGREDSDLVIRLLRLEKVRYRSGRLGVCVAHLFHQENEGKVRSPNEEYFDSVVSSENILARASCIKEL